MTVRIFEFAKIVSVVDGDTCDILIDLGFGVSVKQRFRLAGINTPERGQPGFDEAKMFLATYLGIPAVIHSIKLDKYGRFLADIYVNGISVNQALLAQGLAVPYGS